nr:MAG TPA: hypothetical protein [Caudoviricetes sp.]
MPCFSALGKAVRSKTLFLFPILFYHGCRTAATNGHCKGGGFGVK